MTLAWAARIALALWLGFAVASEVEGSRPQRSPGLVALSAIATVAVAVVLVWAGWFS